MKRFVIDNIKKNQKEIDDLINDKTLDESIKDKLFVVLNQEKNMLQQLKKQYEDKNNHK